jgi:hypothetical protein
MLARVDCNLRKIHRNVNTAGMNHLKISATLIKNTSSFRIQKIRRTNGQIIQFFYVSYGWNAYIFFHSDCIYSRVNNLVADLRNILGDQIVKSLILAFSTTQSDAIWLFLCGFKDNFHKNKHIHKQETASKKKFGVQYQQFRDKNFKQLRKVRLPRVVYTS